MCAHLTRSAIYTLVDVRSIKRGWWWFYRSVCSVALPRVPLPGNNMCIYHKTKKNRCTQLSFKISTEYLIGFLKHRPSTHVVTLFPSLIFTKLFVFILCFDFQPLLQYLYPHIAVSLAWAANFFNWFIFFFFFYWIDFFSVCLFVVFPCSSVTFCVFCYQQKCQNIYSISVLAKLTRGLADRATQKSSESRFPLACTHEPHQIKSDYKCWCRIFDKLPLRHTGLWSELGHSHTICTLQRTTALLEYDYFCHILSRTVWYFLWRPSCTHTQLLFQGDISYDCTVGAK